LTRPSAFARSQPGLALRAPGARDSEPPPFSFHLGADDRHIGAEGPDGFELMTDTTTPALPTDGLQPEGAVQPAIRILAQFVKDLSFENPRAPESLRGGGQPPQIDLAVELNAQAREAGIFEIELKLGASAKRDAEPVFQVELLYGGLFQVVGVEAEDLEQVLLIECPRYLFPFARRLIADLSAEGGFPPLMLEPIDFAAIYLARKAQAAQGVFGTA
jgi:preprotein translocase subunit SecB